MAIKRHVTTVAGVLVAIEFLIYIIAATIIVAVGPFVWVYRLFTSERFPAAAIVTILWAVSVFILCREVKRRAITAVSLGVFLFWLILLVYVFRDLFV
jgi:hypothetical protein